MQMHLSLKPIIEAVLLQEIAVRLGLVFWHRFLIFRHDLSTKDKLRRVFQREEDPYRYGCSSFELERFASMEALLCDRAYECALEVGCAEGAFTRRLEPMCSKLVAVEISHPALKRAISSVRSDHIVWIQANARTWEPESRFDLIVLGDFLYYLGDPRKGPAFARAFDSFVRRVCSWLEPGGRLLLSNVYGSESERKRNEDFAARFERAGLGRIRNNTVCSGTHDKTGLSCLLELMAKPCQP